MNNHHSETDVLERTAELEKELAAKNHELEIEAALEKVRAKTMAMHKSSDLLEVIPVLAEQFQLLGFNVHSTNVNTDYHDRDWHLWICNPGYTTYPDQLHIPYFDHPFFNRTLESLARGSDFNSFVFTKEEKDSYLDHVYANSAAKNASDERKKFTYDAPGFAWSVVYLKNTALTIANYDAQPYTEEQNVILRRFGNVFEQTYTRFLDLQKAEVQAREAQIEAALEKVRAKVMAMNSSDELNETSLVFGEQLRKLGIDWQLSYFWLIEEDKDDNTFWITWPDNQTSTTTYSLAEADQSFKDCIIAWRNEVKVHNTHVPFENVKAWLDTFERITADAGGVALEIIKPDNFKKGVYYYDAMIKFGSFGILINRSINQEEQDIQSRFAVEFERAYSRFLDLQKSEAQAREAKIEAALERVRSRTMGMQHSTDLQDTALLLFQQILALGVSQFGCGFNIWDDDRKAFTAWMGGGLGENTLVPSFKVSSSEDVFLLIREAAERGESLFVREQAGEELETHYRYMNSIPLWKKIMEGITLPTFQVVHCAFFSQGFLLFISPEPISEAHNIFKRFAKVFEQTYTRFLDLQKAEAQAREAQIQLALERVRARAMAMQKSDELVDTAALLFQQIKKLGIQQWGNSFQLWDDDMKAVEAWTCTHGMEIQRFKIPAIEDPVMINIVRAAQEGKDLYVEEMGGEALEDHYKFMYSLPIFKEILDNLAATGITPPKFQVMYAAYFSFGYILFITHEPFPEAHDIFKRFAKVFEQTYTRFLDLQRAEAQAREAQIEAALEKVRSRSLAMHKSEELQQVVAVAFERLRELNISMDAVNIDIFSESTRDADLWIASPGQEYASCFHLPYVDYLIPSTIFSAKEKGDDFFAKTFSFEEKNKYFNYLFEHSDFKHLPESRKNIMLAAAAYTVSFAFTKSAAISIHNYSDKSFSDEENNILKRFARVFEQTYTRFLDLQTAEAQARESQIQLALERVRARTMAMQKSEELMEASNLLFQQVQSLGIPVWSCGYNIWEKGEKFCTGWMSTQGAIQPSFRIPLTEHRTFIHMNESRLKAEAFYVEEVSGEELADHYRYMFSLPDFREIATKQLQKGFPLPLSQINHVFNFKHGNLIFLSAEAMPEAWDIFKRFTAVFEQTYTRFLDLQKAEAQAKEAQIEAALERVRSRSMGMQKSDELKEVIQVVYDQFVHLNIYIEHTGFIMDYKARDDMNIWLADKHEVPFQVTIPYFDCAHWNSFKEAKEKGKEFFANNLSFEEKNRFYRDLFKLIPGLSEETKEYYFSCPGLAISTVLLENVGLYIENFSGISYSDEENKTLLRFGKVFQQTYTRFLDLQRAEAQARTAQIEAALERVRSRTMAMHKSDELLEASEILFSEMQKLGFESLTAGYVLMDKEEKNGLNYTPDAFTKKILPLPIIIPHNETIHMQQVTENWKKGSPYFTVEMDEEETIKHQTFIAERSTNFPMNAVQLLAISPPRLFLHNFYFKEGYLLIVGGSKLSAEQTDIMLRFTKVFQQTYTRFLDLQKAEAQAREAQIELGLERVRARAMAMQKSDELSELVDTVFKELTKLDFALTWCIINIIDEPSMSNTVWAASPDIDKAPDSYHMKFEDYPFHHAMMKGWKERKTKYVYVLEGLEKKIYDEYLFNETEFRKVPEAAQAASSAMEKYVVSFSFSNFGGLQTVGDVPLSDANLDILSRFGKVFDLTYTRFNDLKQAEAQAREAQIGAALERVRSRSMGMQKSEELRDVIQVIYEQFLQLNIPIDGAGFAMDHMESDDFNFWLADAASSFPYKVHIPYFDHPQFNRYKEAKEKGLDFYTSSLTSEERNGFFDHISKYIAIPQELKEMVYSAPGYETSHVVLKNVILYILNVSGHPFSDADNDTLMRFGRAFEQLYIRFNDLKKAEAQAREAQIEAALEKVRSRSLAMHHSNELEQVVTSLFDRLVELGLSFDGALIYLFEKEKRNMDLWVASRVAAPVKVNLPYDEDIEHNTVNDDLWRAIEKGEDIINRSYSGKVKNDYYLYVGKHNELKIPEPVRDMMLAAESWTVSFAAEKNCILGIDSWAGRLTTNEDFQIVKRFARVFEQAYTRFLDLQKAEAQALESQIEAALERVRSRTMAMQHSDELKDAALLLFQQVQTFGVDQWACGYNIWEADGKTCTAWMSRQGTLQPPFKTHPSVDDCFQRFYDAKQRGESFYVEEIGGDEIKTHYKRLISLPEFKSAPKEFFDEFIAPEFQIFHIAYFDQGYLMFITYKPVPQTWDIFKRFAKVFEQTYTRFLDLQKAEAQALEAVKRASVDRVRAEIASMRTTNDLERITPLIWNELTTLGVPFVRCGVFIMDEEKQLVETHLSTPDGKAIASFTSTFSGTKLLTEILPYWQRKEVYKAHWDEAMFLEQAKSLVQQGAITSGEKYLTENRPTDLYLHFLPFLQGMLYAGNTAPLNDDALQLMQNLADAFSTAYARYEDFNKLEAAKEQIEKTLVDLKQAQQQLVQSEKMASLGELTAGIAHEIQNPLNFVNNFSDVNKELLEELKEEAEKGNIEEIKAIANDVINNEEKINHHGKRADAIVKNMLQHSRSSGATKELTDINKLADEYLRLSYHGLRAKDKSFNAKFITDFDKNVDKVNVIPQEIGRVILNLINNAFYAVNERQKVEGAGYEPTVAISIASIQPPLGPARAGTDGGRSVQIKVADNGGGIPQKNLDKIFQPFFTTKPTGQGTGLGLSLSYDIVKAHGGEIKVETEEGEGSEFVIQLPLT